MLKIIAASSLYNLIGELQIKMRKQLQELVHAGPGFSLNPESVNKSKDVYNYLKSEELRDTRIILWHDLINNTITPHKSNNYQPQSVNQLVASLRSLTNLCGIVYCQRTGSPNIFEDLRTLDCPIIQVTTDILSKSEQRSEVLVERVQSLTPIQRSRTQIPRCSFTLLSEPAEDLENKRHQAKNSRATKGG